MKKLYELLKQHVPDDAVHYCYDLWCSTPFNFKVTRTRNSKLGDYRFIPSKKSHTITINHDLNKYSFLVTFIHEYAHLKTQLEHGAKAAPHGTEWKGNFKKLMDPMLNSLIFPEEVLLALKKHMQNPKASSCSDPVLTVALNGSNQQDPYKKFLQELDPGDQFLLKRRIFEMELKRRTRYICREVKTGKKYLIPQIALVNPIEL